MRSSRPQETRAQDDTFINRSCLFRIEGIVLLMGRSFGMRKFKVRVNGEEFEVEVSEVNESREDGKIQVEKIKRIPREITPTNAPMQVTTVLRAPMPGRVLSVQVKKGERVSGGQVAIILEAMKMENEIQIENEGVVTQVFVEENDTVDTGDPLLEFEENPRDIS